MGVNAGEMIHEVTIQQGTDAVGGSKFPTEGWTTLLSAWMCRDTQTGTEQLVAGQVAAAATIDWEMRYVESMDPDLVDVPKSRRLLYHGRVYGIIRAAHMGRQDKIRLTTLSSSKAA